MSGADDERDRARAAGHCLRRGVVDRRVQLRDGLDVDRRRAMPMHVGGARRFAHRAIVTGTKSAAHVLFPRGDMRGSR